MSAHQAESPTGNAAGVDPRSVLLITLDSCRHDTFVAADAPNLKAVGPEVYRAQAPSHFTYASHMAMWVGVTPGVAERAEPYVNPKFAKLFRIANGARRGYSPSAFELEGRNIVEGFRLAGYRAIGSGALAWFNPATPVGAAVTADFDRNFHPGWPYSVKRQVSWMLDEIDAAGDQPVFVFLNVGETHTPYWFEGAPWSMDDNPCWPFQTVDRRDECARRQRAALEYVDTQLAPLLRRFARATAIVTADHGDCWGEDGLWEHGISHEATLTVPLVFRVEARVDQARGRLQAAERAYLSITEAPVNVAEAASGADPDPADEPVSLGSVVALRSDLTRADFSGEVIILDPLSLQYHAAGATGSEIIGLMGDGASVADIVAALIGMYNIDRQTCAEEVVAFLRMLDDKSLLSKSLRSAQD